jgi:hypothetical protein
MDNRVLKKKNSNDEQCAVIITLARPSILMYSSKGCY